MCLILTSNGKEILKDHLQNGWDGNYHGGGFSYFKEGKLHLKKGFEKFEDFYTAYKEVIGNPIIIHFRWATSGLKNEENCHPFEINSNVHFAHNGVINYFSGRIKDRSDTFACNELFLKEIAKINKNKKWWKNKSLKWWMQEAIGKGNKFVFIDNSGGITIYNEASGEWIDKENYIWASNTSYKYIKSRDNGNSVGSTCGYGQFHKTYPNTTSTLKRAVEYVPNDFSKDEEKEARCNAALALQDRKEEESVSHIKDNEEYIDITQIQEDEILEVDRYLEEING